MYCNKARERFSRQHGGAWRALRAASGPYLKSGPVDTGTAMVLHWESGAMLSILHDAFILLL